MSNPYQTPEEEKNNKTANILCIISLILEIAPTALAEGYSQVMYRALDASVSQMGHITSIFEYIVGLSALAGFALMIYVRVKYPKNVFGKVLMILYISLIVLTLVTVAVLLIACTFACGEMFDSCRGLGLIAPFLELLP